MTTPVSRRRLLQGISAGAAALAASRAFGLEPRFARAQGDFNPTPSAFYRFKVGEFDAAIVQDGVNQFPYSTYAVNAPEGAVDAVAAENLLPAGVANVTLSILVLKTADQLALFDTGLGDLALDGVNRTGGRLIPTLELLGYKPEDVTAVITSHFHPDHVGSIARGEGLAFPNATVYFPQAEYDFVQGPAGSIEAIAPFVQVVKAQLAVAEKGGALKFYKADDEVISGVQAISAPGHSPDQQNYLIQSGQDKLLSTVDTATHEVISLAHPEWFMGFDAIGELAAATRRATLERANKEALKVFAYHFAFPGLGYVDTEGEGFRWVPQA
jgi:glyoxylase-like metal-dependent hydrolase (beta-lactamase superfamily II)